MPVLFGGHNIKALLLALILLIPSGVAAQVPNELALVQSVASRFNVGTPAGLDAFVDAVACELNAKDPRFGHLKKNPGQTQTHGHSHDGVLFDGGPGNVAFIDLVVAAGAPTASVNWSPHAPIYRTADWLAPHNCGTVQPPVVTPPTTPTPVPVDLTAITATLARIESALSQMAAAQAATQAAISEVDSKLNGVAGRVEAVLESNDRLLRQQLSPPDYTGRVFGSPITLRPTIKPVNP